MSWGGAVGLLLIPQCWCHPQASEPGTYSTISQQSDHEISWSKFVHEALVNVHLAVALSCWEVLPLSRCRCVNVSFMHSPTLQHNSAHIAVLSHICTSYKATDDICGYWRAYHELQLCMRCVSSSWMCSVAVILTDSSEFEMQEHLLLEFSDYSWKTYCTNKCAKKHE